MNVVACTIVAILTLNKVSAEWSSRSYYDGWTPIYSENSKYKYSRTIDTSNPHTDKSIVPVNLTRAKSRRRIISFTKESPFNIPESAFFRELREIGRAHV